MLHSDQIGAASPSLLGYSHGQSLLRPCWAPPVSGVAGFASPCSTPLEEGGAVSTSDGGLYRGARFFVRAVGPSRTGDRPPECAVCGGWRRSRMVFGWLAERPDSGAKNGSQFGMRVQVKCARVRPDRGSLTSHQDKTACSMFRPCPPSTVHLQSTLINL